jgi:ribosomal protein S27AE
MDDWACSRCGDSFWANPPDGLLCGAASKNSK